MHTKKYYCIEMKRILLKNVKFFIYIYTHKNTKEELLITLINNDIKV